MGKIVVEGDIYLEQISQLQIVTEINEHGKAFFSSIISKDISQQVLKKKLNEITIRYKGEEMDGTDALVLFAGLVHKYVVKKEGDLYYLRAECVSASIKFDRERKNKSLQNHGLTYGQLFHWIMGRDRAIIVTKDSSKAIPHPFIQYDETDWEFIKRISGHIKTVVIPDVCHIYPQISIGMVRGKTYILNAQDGCEIEIDIKNKDLRHNSDSTGQTFSLKIDGELDMNLCDKVIYDGIPLVVLKKEIQIIKGSISCLCWIGRIESKILGLHFNNHLCGLRLPGIVKDVEGEKLEVKLAIDKEDNVQKLYQYTYLPLTGNGMYAMPEIGSSVYLYFPDNDEKGAFVVDCVSPEPLNRPTECKYLETHLGKRLDLCPAELDLNTRKNQIKIANKKGIHFLSARSLSLCAKGNLIIRCGGLANLRSKDSVHMEYNVGNNSYIHLEGVECTIKTRRFLTSDSGRKAVLGEYDPKKAWKADEIAKKTVLKIVGAIPAPAAKGIGGKVLGGIPAFENIGKDIDISKVMGVRMGGD